MIDITKRRVLKGSLLTALVSGPFLIRFFRKPKQLEESAIKWIRPSILSSSGNLSIGDTFFTPLALPLERDVQFGSISTCVSTNKDLVIVSYSYGKDWKARLCCAPLTKKGVGEFSTLLSINKSQSVITGIGCSGIKNCRVSFVLRQCNPDDHDNTVCTEALCFASIRESAQGAYSLPNDLWGGVYDAPNRWHLYKKAFRLFIGINPHLWADGTDSLFFGGRWGVNQYRAMAKNPFSFDEKQVLSFGTEDTSSDRPAPFPKSMICSNIVDNGDQTLSFVTAPRSFIESRFSEKVLESFSNRGAVGYIEQGMITGNGSMVVIDTSGNVLSRVPFPALPQLHQACLTRSHWLFAHMLAGYCIITAPLDDPKNYSVFMLPEEQRIDPETQIPLVYRTHAMLSDGQSILCSRNVGNSHFEEAKKQDFPLTELGIVKLPIVVG